MPIYEYQCTKCGHQLEAFQSMSEAPLTVCPECQQSALTKLVSAAGFQLKGSGWYVTDYSKKGKAKETESKANQSETKAESKPAEKTSDSSTKTSGDSSK